MADKKKEAIGNSTRGVRLRNKVWEGLEDQAEKKQRKLNNLIAMVLENYVLKENAKEKV